MRFYRQSCPELPKEVLLINLNKTMFNLIIFLIEILKKLIFLESSNLLKNLLNFGIKFS